MPDQIKNTEGLLTTSNLSIGYSETHNLLTNLNLNLKQGQLVCFMGPNGIGKSTLIRTLAGLQKPLSGRVNYHSHEELPKFISVVLTDRITATHLTVHELITFGRYPHLDWTVKVSDQDKEIIDRSIQEINIGHLVNSRLYALSDGQLQMAMIARALAQDTPVILLDEPTAHLDLNNRVEIMNTLRKLSRHKNKAILVATHELDLALQMADEIWLAGDNKDILTGLPEDLVLNGSFDKIFQFKGFDLKTGKVQQEAHRKIGVQLSGTDHAYRWTKNALERSGFTIEEHASISIQIFNEKGSLAWLLSKNGDTQAYASLAMLIDALQ